MDKYRASQPEGKDRLMSLLKQAAYSKNIDPETVEGSLVYLESITEAGVPACHLLHQMWLHACSPCMMILGTSLLHQDQHNNCTFTLHSCTWHLLQGCMHCRSSTAHSTHH